MALPFTKIAGSKPKYFSIEGTIKNIIPEFIESGYRFANFKELGNGRKPSVNKDKTDQRLLYNSIFDLLGNPILEDPVTGKEQVIIFDLEQNDLIEVKKLISGLNKDTILNKYGSVEISPELYHLAKESNGSHVIKPRAVTSLRNNVFGNIKARIEIIYQLFQGNEKEANCYINLIKKQHSATSLDRLMPVYIPYI